METGLGGPQLDEKKTLHRIEYFWLCGRCSEEMTLTHERGKGVTAVLVNQARGAIAS